MRRNLIACVGLAVLLASSTAGAQTRAMPDSREQIQLSFAPVVKRTTPAVVNVYSRHTERRAPSPLFDDPLFRRFFGQDMPFSAPAERVQRSLGSGVLVAADGTIVTNHHVIKDADEVTVVLSDRREFEAKILRSDERTDIAILKIDAGGEKLPYLDLGDSDALEVGDLVLAVGNPFGVGQTVTMGIVSALARTGLGVSDYRFFIQTDAAINPGNSGGPLITLDGKIVGINSAIFSQSGGSIGIGFAIPSLMVKTVLAGAGKHQQIVRPWLGASGQALTSEIAASLGLKRPVGVLVKDIVPNSPAAQAGIRMGDVIQAVNGHEVEDAEALRFRVATLPVGSTARITLLRAGAVQEAEAVLTAPPEDPPRNQTALNGNQPLAGATVANLSPALNEELGLDTALRGVVILGIDRRSPAAQLGFAPQDVIVSVNGTEVGSVADLRNILAAEPRRWQMSIRRGDKILNLSLG